MTMQQMLAREDFKARVEGGKEVRLHEMQYPIMQGWDSVEIRSDVELDVKKEEASTQYLVEVRVRPLLIFDDILTEYNAFVDEMSGRYSQEDVDAMGEEEYAAYLSQYAQKIASLMESHADTVTYGEEQSVTVHVQPDSDGIYEIPEEDLQAVDALIIQY